MKVSDRAGIELATPGSAVRHASVARHVTDCAMRPGYIIRVSNGLDTDQNQHSVSPDLGTNSLQRLSADDKSLR